jgi:hypothetical protein
MAKPRAQDGAEKLSTGLQSLAEAYRRESKFSIETKDLAQKYGPRIA